MKVVRLKHTDIYTDIYIDNIYIDMCEESVVENLLFSNKYVRILYLK